MEPDKIEKVIDDFFYSYFNNIQKTTKQQLSFFENNQIQLTHVDMYALKDIIFRVY